MSENSCIDTSKSQYKQVELEASYRQLIEAQEIIEIAERLKSSTTILVVDDDKVTRLLVSHILHRLDYTILLAESGHKAIEILQKESVVLILLDQSMPGMDGFETFAYIKEKMPYYPPVIMMTAYSSLDLAVEFIRTGGADFIQKPIDADVLEVKVRRAIETRRRLYREIAERKQAELALKESEARYRVLFESSADGILIADSATMRMLYVIL
jgi:DNA-binding NtrC family response regulator